MMLQEVTFVQMRSPKACRGHMRLAEVAWGHMMLRSNERTNSHMRLVNEVPCHWSHMVG